MKRLFNILLSLIVVAVFVLSSTVLADGTVTYDGSAQKFIFAKGSKYSPTDLFDGFKDVMPGDTLTQKITVDNKISNDVKINVYLRSVGAEKGSEDFLSQLKLSVKQDGKSNLFAASADQKATLEDWVLLGTVYSGGKINLDLTLEVPKELGNEFQNAVGTLDWQFKVEEMPIEKNDPVPTGDTSSVILVASALACCVTLVCIVSKKRQLER